jgi:hypothetical protein
MSSSSSWMLEGQNGNLIATLNLWGINNSWLFSVAALQKKKLKISDKQYKWYFVSEIAMIECDKKLF